MSRRQIMALCTGALGVVAAASIPMHARATVLVELPLEDLIRDADAVVQGFVDRTGVQLVRAQGELTPHTITRVRVVRWLKGGEGAPVALIRERGGVWQGGGAWIEGTPRYAVGEEVVVLLRRISPTEHRTLSMALGKLVVMRGVPGVPTTVERDLRGVGLATWSNGRMRVAAGRREPPMELESFVELVRRMSALGETR